MENKSHKFEIAGLGIAPFKFVRYEYRTFRACVGAPIQVGGSCDYCATGISHWFWIQDANGREFKVGSECVRHTGDAGLIQQIDKIVAKIQRDKKAEKVRECVSMAYELLEKHADFLRTLPHPIAYQAQKGATMYDRHVWMLANAGNKGRMDTYKALAKLENA